MSLQKNNLKKSYYFIGIKGVGMTMLAQFLKSMGQRVSGSDILDTFLTDQVLASARIKVASPFAVANIPETVEVIVYSSAFNKNNNLELAFIESNPDLFKKTKILSYAAALGEIFNQYQGIAVCGSHGKTTTSAWLGYVLRAAGKKPNVLVGSRVPQFRGSSLVGRSRLMVAETDEYQNKLRFFQPVGVLLNNIDYDHPDFFPDLKSYQQVFADFIKKIPPHGFLITNYHDLYSRVLAKKCVGRVISYDLKIDDKKNQADYIAFENKLSDGYQSFKLNYRGRFCGEFRISLWGEHNIFNALAVIAAARILKVSWSDIRRTLATFSGTERRAQLLGKYRQALIIDDYAHHPTEVESTLAGLRQHYPNKRLVTVFHPHTFTRTQALFNDFISSFKHTDELIILDIYGSARERQGGVSSQQLVTAVKHFNKINNIKQTVQYLSDIKTAGSFLSGHLGVNDVLLLMGAGDVFRVAGILLKK